MKYAMQVELKLLESGFHIERADDIPSGERFYLGVGAVISIYDNGTVLVQGKFKPKYKAWAIRMLKRMLPKETIWKDK